PKIKSEFNADTKKFLEKYFAVWNLEKPTNKLAFTKLKIEALWGLKYADKAYARFDSHGTNYDEAFLNSIKFNANESEFGKIVAFCSNSSLKKGSIGSLNLLEHAVKNSAKNKNIKYLIKFNLKFYPF
ncbi:MAG: hypothetical protein J6W17_04310, partial [Campylobacter sp.]|nr:hypothetical protein [Campylobacter sp.]